MNALKLYTNDENADAKRSGTSESGAGSLVAPPQHSGGLDWVRALAALGVVLLHACVPYLRHPMPGLTWSVTDTASDFADTVFWSIELFIMPVFLVIAGCLLTPTLVRRGPIEMLQTRWKRLTRPLLFGVLVILPIDFYLWLCGWVSEGIIPLVKLKSLKFDGDVDQDLWGLSHLWFLLYMLTYIALVAGGAIAAKRYAVVARIKKTLHKPNVLLPLVATVAVLTLLVRPEVVWGFQHRFEPVPSKWIYSLMFFITGLAWASYDPQLRILSRFAQPQMVAVSLVAGFAAVLMGRWHLKAAGTDTETLASHLLLAGLTVTAASMITVTSIAWAVAKTRRVPKSIAYLAGASFWLYLVHHPVLVLVHIDLKWMLPGTASAVKTILSFAIAVVVSLAMYEIGVRRTRFGRWTGLGESNSTSSKTSAVETILSRPTKTETSKTETPGTERRAA